MVYSSFCKEFIRDAVHQLKKMERQFLNEDFCELVYALDFFKYGKDEDKDCDIMLQRLSKKLKSNMKAAREWGERAQLHFKF